MIRQSIAPGTETPRGTAVQLVISAGPPLVTVPDVTDKNIGEAEQTLKAAGFKVNVDSPAVP